MIHFMMVIWYPEYNEHVLQCANEKQIGEIGGKSIFPV